MMPLLTPVCRHENRLAPLLLSGAASGSSSRNFALIGAREPTRWHLVMSSSNSDLACANHDLSRQRDARGNA